jgi:hypothetical protein
MDSNAYCIDPQLSFEFHSNWNCLPGLTRKILLRNPTNGMAARKRKEREVDKHMGIFLSHNAIAPHLWNGRCLLILQCQTHCISFIEGSASCLPGAQ